MKHTDDELVRMFEEDLSLNLKEHGLYIESEGLFYVWDGSYYKKVTEDQMMEYIGRFLQKAKAEHTLGRDFNIRAFKIQELYSLLKVLFKNRRPNAVSPYISFSDKKVLHTDTLILLDAEPVLYSFFGIDAPSKILDGAPECPRFMKFLSEALVDTEGKTDDEMISFVQEMIGYCLLSPISAHKTFFFYGSGRNGKSVLLDVIRMLVGKDYISNMTIQTLTTNRFATYGLVGKKLNIASEEESKWIKSDLFKSLVAGDPVTVERKYQDPIEFTPRVKFLFATNELPKFDSTDNAIRNRVVIIPFYRYFEPHERDPELTKKLGEEIGGILAWALEGAKRLQANKFQFSIPKTIKNMGKEFEQHQSSALTFFEENYEVTGDPDDFIVKAVMYGSYKDWCIDAGKQAKSSENFFKDVLNVHREKIDTDARRSVVGRQTRVVSGVRATSDESAYINNPVSYA